MLLTDIGINLTHDSYDHDREGVIARARANGVGRLIVTGATVAGSSAALALARAHPGCLWSTAGVHPHHATELCAEGGGAPNAAALHALRSLHAESAVVAVGECGLDYYRNYSPADAQRRACAAQLTLAAECGKPAFLHQRDAHADFMAILREFLPHLTGAVAHCFTGNAAELEDCLAAGLYIGITGWICDERRGAHLGELVRRIPPGRLLLETDGPYLLPRDINPKPAGRRNEPANLPHIARVVARHRGESLEQLTAHTSAAAAALFRLPT